MSGPPKTDLLWQYLYKTEIEKLSKRTAELAEKIEAQALAEDHLQQRQLDHEAAVSAKHDQQDATMAESRTEAQDMAELLRSWKVKLESALQQRDERDRRTRLEVQELKERTEMLEIALQHSVVPAPTATTFSDTQHAINQSIQQTLEAVLGKLTRPTNNDRQLVKMQNDSESRGAHVASIRIGLQPQGTKSFDEYFKYGQAAVPKLFDENVRFLEVEHVKAFVNSLVEDDVRRSLSQTLEIKGWTWDILQQEAMKLMAKR